MKSYKLSFTEIFIIRKDIAEIRTSDGIEITVNMLKELHHFLDNNIELPCSLLINKVNPYNYSFEALEYFGTYKNIKATAVVVHNEITEVVTKFSVDFTRKQA